MRTASKKRPPRRRRYPANRVKTGCSYEVAEVAKLFSVHRNTIRRWLKEGLPTIDQRRPLLIHGTALKAFLVERQGSRRRKCQLGELYCFRCRDPRKPWGDTADVTFRTSKIAKLTALCCDCGTVMHQTVSRSEMPKLALTIELKTLASERLNGCADANVNGDIKKDERNEQAEPVE